MDDNEPLNRFGSTEPDAESTKHDHTSPLRFGAGAGGTPDDCAGLEAPDYLTFSAWDGYAYRLTDAAAKERAPGPCRTLTREEAIAAGYKVSDSYGEPEQDS